MGRFLLLEIAVTLMIVVFLLQNVIYTPSLVGLCKTPLGDIGRALSGRFAETCGQGEIVAGVLNLSGWLYLGGIVLLVFGLLRATKPVS